MTRPNDQPKIGIRRERPIHLSTSRAPEFWVTHRYAGSHRLHLTRMNKASDFNLVTRFISLETQ
jgi:hypothetical protein